MRIEIIKVIQHILDHDNHETREKLKKLFNNEIFIPRYILSLNEENLSWYITQGLITNSQSKKLTKISQLLCSDLAEYSEDLCNAFGIQKHMKTAPISNNWVKYNNFDNRGELLKSARNW